MFAFWSCELETCVYIKIYNNQSISMKTELNLIWMLVLNLLVNGEHRCITWYIRVVCGFKLFHRLFKINPNTGFPGSS